MKPRVETERVYDAHAMAVVVRMLTWALLILSVLGCEHSERKRGKLDRASAAAHQGAVLTGTVRLAPGATLPSYAQADMERRPLRPIEVDNPDGKCAAANAAARQPVKLAANRALSDIVVAASDFVRQRAHEPAERPHKVTIRNCALSPRTLSATVGDQVFIANSDHHAYAPMFGPLVHALKLAPGERFRVPLQGAGIESVMCTRDAPCGRTDVVAFHHDVHTVTNETGSFRLEHFPAGESVRVSAWHPLFEVSETFVWLEPNEQREVELVMRPRPGL